MWTIKVILSISQLLLKMVNVATAVAEESKTFIEEDPVYWVDTGEVVYDGHVNVNINLDIKVISPCYLEAFPPGFNKTQEEIDKMRSDCSKKYLETFLLPLTGLYHCSYKEQETVPIDRSNQNVSVKLALLVGYGSIYSFSSISGDEDISKMKLGETPNVTILLRELLVNMIKSKLSEKGSFENLLQLSDLKVNLASYYEDSKLSSHSDELSRGNIPDENFLQVIGIENFQKAFGDVLLHPARNFSCSFYLPMPSYKKDYSYLNVAFSLPKVNRDLRVFHSESFELTEKIDNYTCVLKYNGTENVVWSTKQNCIVAKNLANTRAMKTRSPVFTQSISCIPVPNEDKPYFVVSACYEPGSVATWDAGTWQWLPLRSLSYKRINQTFYYNYCNDGFINFPTENDPPIPCPPFVFRTNTEPRIFVKDGNRMSRPYIHSNIYDTVLPASITINKMLFPAALNTTAILMSQLPIRRETITIETFVYPHPAILAMLTIIGSMIFLIMLGALVYLSIKFDALSNNANRIASIKFWKNPIQTI